MLIPARIAYYKRTPNISHTTHIWVCVEFICKFRPELRISGVFSKFLILHTPVFKLSSDWILTNLGSLDSSRREESNGSKIAFLASILIELLRKTYFTIRYLWVVWEMFGVLFNLKKRVFDIKKTNIQPLKNHIFHLKNS